MVAASSSMVTTTPGHNSADLPPAITLERDASTMAVRAATRGSGGAGKRAGRGVGVAGAAAAGGGVGDLFWPYVTRAAEILTTFSKSDGAVKEGVAEDQCLQGEGNGCTCTLLSSRRAPAVAPPLVLVNLCVRYLFWCWFECCRSANCGGAGVAKARRVV